MSTIGQLLKSKQEKLDKRLLQLLKLAQVVTVHFTGIHRDVRGILADYTRQEHHAAVSGWLLYPGWEAEWRKNERFHVNRFGEVRYPLSLPESKKQRESRDRRNRHRRSAIELFTAMIRLQLESDTLNLQAEHRQQLLRALEDYLHRQGKWQQQEEVPAPNSVPDWREEEGRIVFRGHRGNPIVHRAANMRSILNAFQEQDWPHRIDDPLPNGPDEVRLHNTVRSLNRKHELIRFASDGTGKGITWEEIQ